MIKKLDALVCPGDQAALMWIASGVCTECGASVSLGYQRRVTADIKVMVTSVPHRTVPRWRDIQKSWGWSWTFGREIVEQSLVKPAGAHRYRTLSLNRVFRCRAEN